MASHLDMIRGRQVIIPLTNKSGGTCAAGSLVVLSEDHNESFELTNIEGDDNVIGVTAETILDNEPGRIICSGYASAVLVNGAVTRGDYLVPSTTSGKATGKVDAIGLGILGIALESGDTSVAAYLFHVVRGAQGITGPQGYQGNQGYQGYQGLTGPAGGSNTQVIFNDNDVAVGDAGMTYDKDTDTLTLAGRIEAENSDQIKISADDTASGFPETKIVAGDGIDINVADDGGNETLVVSNTANMKTVVMAKSGVLSDSDIYPFRAYPGVNGTIIGVRAAVGVAPAGASVKVDVLLNGVTIFTEQDNRPEIEEFTFTGLSETIDVNTITDTDYLSFTVDQIGSELTGEYLTVHVYIEVD